jgi:5-methylcytosine-specific restriction endonuclease McrA
MLALGLPAPKNPPKAPMKITREFIEAHRTERGGWTNKQCQALGEKYAPVKGWIERAIAADHTPEAIANFIKFASRDEAKAARAALRAERKALKKERRLIQQKPKKPKNVATSVPRYAGDVNADSFLSSFEWRKLRMQVLRHYGPRCMCCGATPADGAMMNIDHIKPRRTHPHLALAFDNLQVLCNPCNHGKGNWDSTDWRPAEERIDPDVASFIRSIAQER